jgi:hypothetical protein
MQRLVECFFFSMNLNLIAKIEATLYWKYFLKPRSNLVSTQHFTKTGYEQDFPQFLSSVVKKLFHSEQNPDASQCVLILLDF